MSKWLAPEQKWSYCLTLGFLMNTRGLVSLVVLNIAVDLVITVAPALSGEELTPKARLDAQGILTQRLFSVMVVMCLATTFMTSPLVWAFSQTQSVLYSSHSPACLSAGLPAQEDVRRAGGARPLDGRGAGRCRQHPRGDARGEREIAKRPRAAAQRPDACAPVFAQRGTDGALREVVPIDSRPPLPSGDIEQHDEDAAATAQGDAGHEHEHGHAGHDGTLPSLAPTARESPEIHMEMSSA